ncbi:MAG: ADP-ribosylation factor family protein [Candidatus Heimdallarchaeota archaeon]
MSLFKKLARSKASDNDEQKTVAIVGLDGAGKTTIINRLLRSDFKLTRPTFGVSIEIYKYRSLEFVVYDLGGQTPLRESLWEKFVASADGLVFVLDSADKRRFDLAAEEFNNALSYNKKAPILFLSNKIDLEDAASQAEVLNIIDFSDLNRKQRSYFFSRCSALTGQFLFESWDWLTLKLSDNENSSSINVKMLGCYHFNDVGKEIETSIFGKPKTQSKYVELFKKGKSALISFIRKMLNFEEAETLLQVGKNQLVIVKKKENVLGIVIGENDPASRAITVLKGLHEKIMHNTNSNLMNIISDNYPLDVMKENVD